jgi:O-antigen/teichoic acid export membrane protein
MTWGIEGVAIAADVMLFTGILLIFRHVRRFVDFSMRRLFAFPLLALTLAGVAGLLVSTRLDSFGLWPALLCKAAVVSLVYFSIMIVFERAEYRRTLQTVLSLVRADRGPKISTLP